MATITLPQLLSVEEAAQYLRLAPRTLSNWRGRGIGPRYVKMGDGPRAAVRYRRADIDAWLACRLATTPA